VWAPQRCGSHRADPRYATREGDAPTRATPSRSSDTACMRPPRAVDGMRIVFSCCGPDRRATSRCGTEADGSEQPSSCRKRPHACRRPPASWGDGSRGWCMPSSPASATSGHSVPRSLLGRGACSPLQTVRRRVPPGCRPHRRAGTARGVARQRPGCRGAGGGACWGGRGRRGGVKRPFVLPLRLQMTPSPGCWGEPCRTCAWAPGTGP
jgi:hypothetical protein